MALVNYSSSSDAESDVEPPSPKILRISTVKRSLPPNQEMFFLLIRRLPLPSAISCMIKVIHASPVNDPSKHDGRVRSFVHERGNWATLVYVPVELSIIDEVQTTAQHFLNDEIDLKYSDNTHISLTKTVVLRHHWIDSFVQSLQKALVAIEHFPIDFQSLNVYTNEDKTRTFIGLVASEIYFEKLHNIMLKMDAVMNDFRLDTFYENPSFHASILWCVGNHEEILRDKLPELNAMLSEMRKANPNEFRIAVDKIHFENINHRVLSGCKPFV